MGPTILTSHDDNDEGVRQKAKEEEEVAEGHCGPTVRLTKKN